MDFFLGIHPLTPKESTANPIIFVLFIDKAIYSKVSCGKYNLLESLFHE